MLDEHPAGRRYQVPMAPAGQEDPARRQGTAGTDVIIMIEENDANLMAPGKAYVPVGSVMEQHKHGGEGSGNFGHAGRPGEVGGSGPGGTPSVPKTVEYFNIRYSSNGKDKEKIPVPTKGTRWMVFPEKGDPYFSPPSSAKGIYTDDQKRGIKTGLAVYKNGKLIKEFTTGDAWKEGVDVK